MPKKHSRKPPARDHVAFVVSSLSNPKEPQHCGTCLYTALILTTSNSSHDHAKQYYIPTSLRKKVDFWNALYTFIVQPRTDEEVESLLQQLARCYCPLAVCRYQSQAARMGAEDLVQRNSTLLFAPEDKKALYTHERITFVTKAFIILSAGLHGSGVKSVAKGLVQTWPTTPLDLLPFGADSLVQTLLQWYRFIPDPIIFGLAGRITHVCQFLLIPSLAKFQFSRTAILRGKEEVEAIQQHVQSASQDALRTDLIRLRYNWYTSTFLDYFRVIYDELPPPTRTRVLAGCETKAMQLFSMFLYIPNRPDSDSQTTDFSARSAAYCCQLFRFFHIHLHPHPNYPVHPSVTKMDKIYFTTIPASVRTVPTSVASHINCFHDEIQCNAYGCSDSIQSSRTNFQRCSRCQIVSYCSQECQIRAWRDEKIPHKRVCPILRLLIDTAGGLEMFINNPSQNREIMELGDLHERRVITLQRWEVAGVDRDLIQYVHGWTRWLNGDPKRIMPDGSWWNPGFEDYDEMVQRMKLPYHFLNRLLRWPCEEAWVKATLELLPFFEQEVDRYVEPLPQGWNTNCSM
ncbi:hypothetical protein CPB83DRAFT_893896 [Crepidotus variabilis]|uniref:MYND-type domain-containing protein n=1 Tax=Crepidotus variabilis TaxID=179855 RepID=A0A9P6EG41_9AGAR|nr:hypothetical protein CPB83DRAFT_893896 [Crepidotus variabilis]